MSLDHKNVIRNNDEYFCTACGKSWDAADRDPPQCGPVARATAPYNGGYLAPFVPDAPTDAQQVAALRYERPRDAGKTTERMRRMTEQKGWMLFVNYCRHGVPEPWKTPSVQDVARMQQRFNMFSLPDVRPLSEDDFAPLDGLLTSFLVRDLAGGDDHLLVYARDMDSARKYAEAVTGISATLELRRIQAMDRFAHGLSAYTELNPKALKEACRISRKKVVSLMKWRRG